MPGRLVKRETYLSGVPGAGRTETACRSCPMAFRRTSSSPAHRCWPSLRAPPVFGPFGPTGEPDPTIIQTVPEAGLLLPLDLLGAGAAAALDWRRFALLIGPVDRHPRAARPAVPRRRGREELAPAGRSPCFVILIAAVAVAIFTHLGIDGTVVTGHGCLERRSGARAVPQGPTALERQGAAVFQAKQCRNCHALGRRRRRAAGRRSTTSRCGSRGIS